MRLCLISDTHFGLRGDSSYFLNYQEEYYTKRFFPYLKKEKIATIIHLGDLFDKRKAINPHTYKRVREFFIDPVADVGTMQIIAGNHDTYTDASNAVNSLDMVIPRLRHIEYVIEPRENAEFGFLAIPWITKETYEKTRGPPSR